MRIVDEPRGSVRHKVDWKEVAEAAEANPGKWVEVPVPLSLGMRGQIRRRQVRAIDPDKFEVATRKNTDTDDHTFYVRLRASAEG